MTEAPENRLRVPVYTSGPEEEQPLYAPSGELLTPNRLVEPAPNPPEQASSLMNVVNRLIGTAGGMEPRLQLWPEKMIRSAVTLPHDAGVAAKLENADLKIGGEGMRAFYDKMLVDAAKKLGVKVEKGHVFGQKS